MPFDDDERTALAIAQDLIFGDRNATYGHPLDDMTRTGKMWAGTLSEWAKDPSQPIPAELVALCMIQVKISRLVQTPGHADSVIDIAGYDGCYERIINERSSRAQP